MMTKPMTLSCLFIAVSLLGLQPSSSQANPATVQPQYIGQAGEATASEEALQRALELFGASMSSPSVIPARMKSDTAQPIKPRRHFDGNFILGGAEAFPM